MDTADNLNVVNLLAQLRDEIRTKKSLSLGQSKLLNLIDLLLQTNLNLIDKFYFDEPDAFLDENGVKAFRRIINLLLY